MRQIQFHHKHIEQYYPFANEKPQDLLAFRPSSETSHTNPSLNILLLGGGGGDSLRWTLFLNSLHLSVPPKLQVTFNDISPAILARQLILAHLAISFVEGSSSSDWRQRRGALMWELWYNACISSDAAELLLQVVEDLLADLTSSSTVRFVTVESDSAPAVKECLCGWLRMLKDKKPNIDEKTLLSLRRVSIEKQCGRKLEDTLPLPRTSMPAEFMRTGSVDPWDAVDVAEKPSPKRVANPLMWPDVGSSGPLPSKSSPWKVHRSSLPFDGFPPLMENLLGDSKHSVPWDFAYVKAQSPFSLIAAALEVFGRELFAFGTALTTPNRLQMTLVLGDCLKVMEDLANGPAPRGLGMWDVIDSNNLMDFVPLLSILARASPLLRRKPGKAFPSAFIARSLRNVNSVGAGWTLWTQLKMTPLSLGLTLGVGLIGGGDWSPGLATRQEATNGATGWLPNFADAMHGYSTADGTIEMPGHNVWAFGPLPDPGRSGESLLEMKMSQNHEALGKDFITLLQATFTTGQSGSGGLEVDTPIAPRTVLSVILQAGARALSGVEEWLVSVLDNNESDFWTKHMLAGNYCQAIVASLSMELGGKEGCDVMLPPRGALTAELQTPNVEAVLKIEKGLLIAGKSYGIHADVDTPQGHTMYKDLEMLSDGERVRVEIPGCLAEMHEGNLTLGATLMTTREGLQRGKVIVAKKSLASFRDATVKCNGRSWVSRALKTRNGTKSADASWTKAGGALLHISSVTVVPGANSAVFVRGSLSRQALELLSVEGSALSMEKAGRVDVHGCQGRLWMGLRLSLKDGSGREGALSSGVLYCPLPVARSRCRLRFSRDDGRVMLVIGLGSSLGVSNPVSDGCVIGPLPRLITPISPHAPPTWVPLSDGTGERAAKSYMPIQLMLSAQFYGAEREQRLKGSSDLVTTVALVRDTLHCLFVMATQRTGEDRVRLYHWKDEDGTARLKAVAGGVWMNTLTGDVVFVMFEPSSDDKATSESTMRANTTGVEQVVRVTDSEWSVWEECVMDAGRALGSVMEGRDASEEEAMEAVLVRSLRPTDVVGVDWRPIVLRPLFAPRTSITQKGKDLYDSLPKQFDMATMMMMQMARAGLSS